MNTSAETRPSVVHVVVAGEIGGAERMLVDLARPREDAERIHSVALFTPNDGLRALLRSEAIDVDDRGSVREGPLPYLASTFGSRDVMWLTEVLARRRAAVVHLHTFASQVLGTRAAQEVHARVVRTEHSTRVYDDPSCWPFSRWSLRRTDAVVCISEHVQRIALARASFLERQGTRISIVHNGVDTTRFVPRPRRQARTEDGAPASEGMVRFVALGRLDPRKGLDLALAALAQVPRAELAIVGDGALRGSLEQLARQLGVEDRVRFEGYVGDVRDALADADVALASAKDEGLGVALIEAMAMERPVVAVPAGGLPEVVIDGETGWLAARRDPDALARAMQAAVDAPDERILRGERARARVLETFSLEAMRGGYERVYSALTT